MSTLNILPEHSSFGRPPLGTTDAVNAGPFSYSAANTFPADFHGLPMHDEDTLWDLSPNSPLLPSWNSKRNAAFVNPGLERDLKNTHVRNGQPTPPLYDDKSPDSPMGLYYAHLDGAMQDPTDHLQRDSFSDHSGIDTRGSYKRRRMRDPKRSSSRFSPSDCDDHGQEKAKREKFLERNRLAASKCRQKKKEHTMLLETRYKEQSDKKEKLMAEIARLRSEILGLKNEVLKHAQCGDEPIKLHLAQMVKKITYKDSSSGGIADAAEVTSTSEDPETPAVQPSLSFGFDDQLHLENTPGFGPFDPQLRRESEASLISDASSYPYTADDSFDDLINV